MYYKLRIGSIKNEKDNNKAVGEIINKKNKDKKKFIFIDKSDNPNDYSKFEVEQDEEIMPLMTRQNDMPLRCVIAGSSGCGKSYLASYLAKDYNRVFPKNEVVFVGYSPEDDNYKGVKNFYPVRVDESILDDPMQVDELHDKLTIYDDIEVFPDKDIVKALERLRNATFNAGRKYNTDVLSLRQVLLDSHKTKDLLNSTCQVIFYPQSSSRYGAHQWMKRYLFLDNQKIEYILNLPSRWILINCSMPMYVLYSGGCFLLNSIKFKKTHKLE